MTYMPLLFAPLAGLGLLAGCDQAPVPVAGLAADPVRLHRITAQCRHGEHDPALCRRVDQAELRRFLSGQSGSHEYRTLAELPAIPASFEEPGSTASRAPGAGDQP